MASCRRSVKECGLDKDSDDEIASDNTENNIVNAQKKLKASIDIDDEVEQNESSVAVLARTVHLCVFHSKIYMYTLFVSFYEKTLFKR